MEVRTCADNLRERALMACSVPSPRVCLGVGGWERELGSERYRERGGERERGRERRSGFAAGTLSVSKSCTFLILHVDVALN